MARIRVPLVTGLGGIQAAAPTFTEVPDSYTPITPGVIHKGGITPGIPLGHAALAAATVLVDVPDEDVTGGALDPVKVKARYPDHFLVKSGVIK